MRKYTSADLRYTSANLRRVTYPCRIAEQDLPDVESMADATEVLDVMRSVNDEDARPDHGVLWKFRDGMISRMLVGVRGDVGTLVWIGDFCDYIPNNGTNPKTAHYNFYESGCYAPQPAYSEIPVEQVHQAVAELIDIHDRRPTCVQWKFAPVDVSFIDTESSWTITITNEKDRWVM